MQQPRPRSWPARAGLSLEDYRLLARFRHLVRQFFVFSEASAKAAGVTAQQHRAVLSIKVFDGRATVGDLARDLMIKHHSAVGLADRLVRGGLITRNHDPADRRRVTLALTAEGEAMLLAVSGANRNELRRLAPMLRKLMAQLER
jgi:DNA-binding MarR family transcriptional regulator